MGSINGVKLTSVKIIENPLGNVLHGMKSVDETFFGFGEAYFSLINFGAVKGWKKHTQMILNLVVPAGEILFVLFDAREDSNTYGTISEIKLSLTNYQRLTIPPNIWVAFKGLSKEPNMLLNIASIPHDSAESLNMPIENSLIPYSFSQ